jgi:HlyB family type I secretion system ABC transporter
MWRRIPLVRQSDSSECGAAALATVAQHYQIPVGLQQLRDLTGTDRAGTTLLALLEAAERLGFAARGVQGSFDDLGELPLPAIAHIHRNGERHFVVLFRVGKTKAVIADPASGVQKLSREEFCRCWTGYLLLLVPDLLPPQAATGAGHSSPTGRFLALLMRHTGVLTEAMACGLLLTALGLAPAYFLQHLVDSVLVRQEVRLLNALGIGLGALVVFRTLFGAMRHYLLAHLGRRVDLTLMAGYGRHLLRLPLSFFEMRQVGEVLSRVNDVSKVREAIGGASLTVVADGTFVVLLLGVLWLYDVPLALVTTLSVPLLVGGVMAHHPAVRRRLREALEATDRYMGHLAEDVSGVETVKALGAERHRSEEGEARLVKLAQTLFKLQKLGLSMDALASTVTALAGLGVLWYGAYRVLGGHLTVGQLMFFYFLLGAMLAPLERLASVNLRLQDALVAVDRLYQVLDLNVEPLGEPGKVPFAGVREGIDIQDVGFRYGCRAPVLEGLTLRIPAGRTVALVGESGSGKSTLLKLLLGFYAPTAGRIRIDGLDLADYDLASLRARVGLVSQDPFFFSGSLRDNLTLSQPSATLEDVIKATRAAGLEDFVAGLPERFNTPLGERGANVSGGQRQRLAIARALLRDPDILIFDEATSHLDTATERAILENLKDRLAGKTVVLVAHRLSTIKEADLIYVLRRGRVVEAGSHHQLMDRGGWYAELWCAQASGPTPSLQPKRQPTQGAAL